MLSIQFGNFCFVCSRRDKKPIKKKLPKKKGDLPDKQVKVKTFSCPDKRLRKSVLCKSTVGAKVLGNRLG